MYHSCTELAPLPTIRLCMQLSMMAFHMFGVPMFTLMIKFCHSLCVCMHVCLTWEDINVSVLGHVRLVHRSTDTIWSVSDTLHTLEGVWEGV